MTGYSERNAAYSQAAHRAAQEQFYPKLWPGNKIEYIDTVKAVEDLKYAVDVIALVTLPDPDARAPIKFYIQERWRKPSWGQIYRDLTVTEWNLRTNQPSELHKLGAQIFVYGYFDDKTGQIVDAVAVDIVRMQHANACGELKYTRKRRGTGDQSFIGIDWDHLEEIGAMMYTLNTTVETLPEIPNRSRFTPEECAYWGLPNG